MSKYMNSVEHKKELYCTPPHITKALLRREIFGPRIWEPAAGRGHIVRVLRECGYEDVVASDLHDWGSGYDQRDFLISEMECDSLVTNPPYSLAHQFVCHAKRVVTHKFAMLLPIQFDFTRAWMDRHERDRVFPLKAWYGFLNSIPWENFDQTPGLRKHAWFVFERGFKGEIIREKIVFRKTRAGGGAVGVERGDRC